MAQQGDRFVLRLTPAPESGVPPFNALAEVVRDIDDDAHPEHPIYIPPLQPSHPIALPGDPWWGTGLPDTPPTEPEVVLVWIFVPVAGKWVQGYVRADGAGPKDEECKPPSPPGWTLVWAYVLSVQRWVQGYMRVDQGGPK